MKIHTVITVYFILVALIAAVSGSYYLYDNSNQLVKEETINHLQTAAQSRAEHIESFLKSLMDSVATVATHSELSEKKLMEIRELNPNIHSFYVLNSKGITISSSGETPCEKGLSQNKVFIGEIKSTTLINQYYCKTFGERTMAIATPHAGGVLVARVNMSGLERIVKERTGLGETGEVLVAIQGNEERIYLFERLFESEALLQKIEDLQTAEPMKQALLGKELIFENALDYRDEPVIAVSQYIEIGRIGLVAKIDIAEALGEQRERLFKAALLVAITTIFLVGGVSFFVSKRITKPIKRLTANVNAISKGKLDVQLNKSKLKEVQSLTQSLNRVLASMKLAILRTGITKSDIGLGEVIKTKKEAEERHEVLYESSMDAIMTLEPPKWNFTAGNPAAIKMFQAKDETDFIRRTPGGFSPKYQPDGQLSSVKAKRAITKAMKTGSNFFNWTNKRRNGEEFPTTVLLTRVKLKDKTFLQATVRDLTKSPEANVKPAKIKVPLKPVAESVVKNVVKSVKTVTKPLTQVAEEVVSKVKQKKKRKTRKKKKTKKKTKLQVMTLSNIKKQAEMQLKKRGKK